MYLLIECNVQRTMRLKSNNNSLNLHPQVFYSKKKILKNLLDFVLFN